MQGNRFSFVIIHIKKYLLQVIPVTSFGLGCWQVYRLQWKLELIDKLHATSHATPIDLPQKYVHCFTYYLGLLPLSPI